MPKVLISDKLSQNAVDVFAAHGVDSDVKTGLSAEELQAIIGAYDGLAIRSATKVTEAVLAAADNLKVVGRAGIGVDNVDIAAATKRGVVVMNTPYGNAVTTAEHTIAMMLALARQIPQASQSTKAGKWEKSRFMGTELTGKRLGLVGCGNIGSIVAERAPGLRMRLVGYDPYLSEENAKRMGVEKVDLDELLRRANFISIHAPMTAATRNIIGAALDVFMQEPSTDNILFDFDAVVATPHLGASTVEAQEKVAVLVAEQMAEYLTTGALTNALNIASVSAEEAPVLKSYMDLGSRLGGFWAR
jgi:D-3-phosphoglycerate dehydrogenase